MNKQNPPGLIHIRGLLSFAGNRNNGMDPLGLFRFGKRPLGFLPENWHSISGDGSIADENNFEPKHEHGFYEDGTGDNVGLFKEGKRRNEDIKKYKLENKHYDDDRIRRTEKSIGSQQYNLLGLGDDKNNCQDYADKLRQRYQQLQRGDRMR